MEGREIMGNTRCGMWEWAPVGEGDEGDGRSGMGLGPLGS